MRRWSFRTIVCAVALVLALFPSGAGGSDTIPDTTLDPTTTSTDGEPVPAMLDLTGAVDDTTVVPAGWPAPEAATGIGPGSHLLIEHAEGTFGCTANFVWRDRADAALYLGTAGHCVLPPDKKATHGAGADAFGYSPKVFVCVADCSFGGETGFVITGELRQLGALVYGRQESAGGEALGYDFGLVEIPAVLHDMVRPSMPVFDGPTGIHGNVDTGTPLCHYGAGVVVGETFVTQARTGLGTFSDDDEGWWHGALAGLFGDSGSAVNACTLDDSGYHGTTAVGVLTHLGGGLFGTTTARAIDLARHDANLDIALVTE